jgi:hypothetical protein
MFEAFELYSGEPPSIAMCLPLFPPHSLTESTTVPHGVCIPYTLRNRDNYFKLQPGSLKDTGIDPEMEATQAWKARIMYTF